MRKHRIVRVIAFLPILLIVFAGLVGAVYALWNWLMPAIFAVHTITYWQALGLMTLSWILFRGFRGPRFAGGHWRGGMRERWEKMTPAERDVFVKAMRSRWSWATPTPTPTEPEAKA